MPSEQRLITVVETQEFQARAARRMADHEREAFIRYLAEHPEAGDLMPGTGGCRKVRWGYDAKGKRGGVRIIYYYHSAAMPIFVLTVFAKNERSDLTPNERRILKQLASVLVKEYQGR